MTTSAATTPRRAAVLGHPIEHSLSPVLHTSAYQALGLTGWHYGRHDIDEDDLPGFLASLDSTWAGLSLTMPLKHRVMDLVDHVEPLALAVGAVNTVLVSPAGPGDAVTLTGTNTDVYGLVQALREGLDDVSSDADTPTGVVLGGGATAASALAALAELGCTSPRVLVRSVARTDELRAAIARMGVTPQLVEADLTGADRQVAAEITRADIVVSTMPPRAADSLAASLTAAQAVGHRGVLLDVAYDPRPTALLAAWRAAGGTAVSGERMLLHQAVAQVRLMTGHDGPLRAMDTALSEALNVEG